ncbi:hypothetical protein ANO14919_099280 [Xylariales sp. No.14919]|nr:hypothetical protein ANO14919_099280 [Xylariales sp. No.14919]
MRAKLPKSQTWRSINVYGRIFCILAMVVGNFLAGAPLCYDEERPTAAMKYSKDISAAIQASKMWPRFLRPAIKYFLLPVGMIILYWEKAQKMLRALITELRASELGRMETVEKLADIARSHEEWPFAAGHDVGLDGKESARIQGKR